MSTFELIDTGIVMGIIHVLTGPAHLSALVTLCGTDVSSRRERNPFDGFLLGIRWGVGHAVGLLVVSGASIAAEESTSEWIRTDGAVSCALDGFVGAFMLGLGSYGLAKAFRHRAAAVAGSAVPTDPDHAGDESIPSLAVHDAAAAGIARAAGRMPPDHRRGSMEIITQMADVLNRDGDSMRRISTDEDDVESRIFNAVESLRRNSDDSDDDEDHEQFAKSLTKSAKVALSQSFVQALTCSPPPMKASSLVRKHSDCNSMAGRAAASPSARDRRPFGAAHPPSPGALAVLAGALHGAAGPAGVLGVMPAAQLRDAGLAGVYLSAFCVTSALVMGCFAFFCGSFGEWLAEGTRRRRGRGSGGGSLDVGRVFKVEFASAFLSVAVGIVWLVLLSVGKLDEVFP